MTSVPVVSGRRAPLDVASIRQDFPILKQRVYGRPLVYLDNASTTQKPQVVIDRLTRFYVEENANVHRGVHRLSERATEAFEAARAAVGAFLNAADSREIVFVRGTTEAINLVAQSYGRSNVGRGDAIVISAMEHHSNIVPWQLLCEERGAQLRIIPTSDAGGGRSQQVPRGHLRQVGLSRRWQPARRGRRFDLRRTLRVSLQTGGEALTPRWLRRPRRTPRFVLLIDGSRSMSGHARDALRVAVAMASVTTRVEVFTFSTALQRVTGDVRRVAAGETRRLASVQYAWGGGTSIGVCLREFLRKFGERLLGRDTVVIIASDGLDVGEPDTLRGAMCELHRRSAGLVWLNPLLETPGFEPTARGMSAARPYITTFASVTDLASFARLSRLLRVRV